MNISLAPVAFVKNNRKSPVDDHDEYFCAKKDRPNAIGLCRVELLAHEGRTITVKYLDAIDGTPVPDIKPVFKEFDINDEIRQPRWVADLMKNYWV